MKTFLRANRFFFYFIVVLGILWLITLMDRSYLEVSRTTAYYEKTEVALYLKQYGELPINYLTKDQANGAFNNFNSAIINDFNIGGDVFRYDGLITTLTSVQDLHECDIYPDRQETISSAERGTFRFVYTADGDEIYYTYDHYDSFVRITWLSIQWKFVVSVVITIAYLVGVTYLFIVWNKKGVLTLREIKEDGIMITRKVKIWFRSLSQIARERKSSRKV